jgi:hypothetical protein
MDDDATDAAWHQQELDERQQIEESWQAMCAACLDEWKAQFEAMTSFEATERKLNYGHHGK